MNGREPLSEEIRSRLQSGEEDDLAELENMTRKDPVILDILSNYIAESDDQEAKSNAIRVVGNLNPLLLDKPMLSMLNSDDSENRAAAAYICGVYKLKGTKPALEVVLENDESSDVRYWAAASLGEVGDYSSIPLLTKALEDKEWAENQDTVESAAQESINRIRQRK